MDLPKKASEQMHQWDIPIVDPFARCVETLVFIFKASGILRG